MADPVSFELEIRMPPVLEALEIARGLTHATYTAAKGAALVAALEQALDVGGGPIIHTTDPLRDSLFTHREVTPDEIDEDPPELAPAILADDGSFIDVEDLAGVRVLVEGCPTADPVVGDDPSFDGPAPKKSKGKGK